MWNHDLRASLTVSLLFCGFAVSAAAAPQSRQPSEPIDITPIDGDVYYVLNQLSGLQAGLNDNSTVAGGPIVQQAPSFTDLGQRWAFTKLSGGFWRIGNLGNGLCFDSAPIPGADFPVCPQPCGRRPVHNRGVSAGRDVVQNPCTVFVTEQWTLTPTTNGYYTISNNGTGLALDLSEGSVSA